MNTNEQFILRDVKPLGLANSEKIHWISGDLRNISTSYPLKAPDVFKILFFDKVDVSYVDKNFALTTDKYDYLNAVLPHDSDGWGLLGSNFNSATILYGEKDEVLKAEKIVEDVLFDKVGGMTEVDFDMGGFSYLIWHFENGKSLMILHNDEMYVFPLKDLLTPLNLLLVGSGAHADDILATEFLTAALIKELRKVKVDEKLSEDCIEYYTDDFEYDDYLLLKGKPIKKKDKPLVLELAYIICCVLLNQHHVVVPRTTESSDGEVDEDEMSLSDISMLDTIEVAKRIKKLYESD